MQQWYVSECLLAYFFSIEGPGIGISRIMRIRMRMKSYIEEYRPDSFSFKNINEKDFFAASSLIARSTKVDCFPQFVLTKLRIHFDSRSKDRFVASCPSSSGGLPPSVKSLAL